MTTKVVVLATPNPEKTAGAKAYSEAVQPLLKAAGVSPSFRGPVAEAVAGDTPPATVMLLEFPTDEAASAFFAQEAYQELVALRDDSFTRMEIYRIG